MTPTHFVLPRGRNSMVKEASFFRSQGGDREDWGKAWLPVVVDNTPRFPQNQHTNPDVCAIENARKLASYLPPIKGWEDRRERPFVEPHEALNTTSEIRAAIGV